MTVRRGTLLRPRRLAAGELLPPESQVLQDSGAPLEVVHGREGVLVGLVTGSAVVAGDHGHGGAREDDLAWIAAQEAVGEVPTQRGNARSSPV
ncbi:MAG: hypothetical protein JO115_07405 [Pseudonocardiales bacterium]|nr:hypothetical protein [Pseudonocardiales bacterium]